MNGRRGVDAVLVQNRSFEFRLPAQHRLGVSFGEVQHVGVDQGRGGGGGGGGVVVVDEPELLQRRLKDLIEGSERRRRPRPHQRRED